jgi:hypothetical protein
MRLFPRNVRPRSVEGIPSEGTELLRRYEITVERELLQMWTGPGLERVATCVACGREVRMLSPANAAAMARSSTRQIYRWVEEARIHFVEPVAGGLLICGESLQQFLSKSLELPGPTGRDAQEDER